jgi:hypothetical protein
MIMALKNTIKPVPLQLLNSTALSAVLFTPFPNPLPQACFMIRLINRSNRLITVSYDGVNAHDVVFAEENLTLNFEQNSQPTNEFAWMKKGTQVYLLGNPIGANGFIYLCGYYQESQ